MDKLALYIESLIFASPEPISIKEIGDALFRFSQEEYTTDLIETYIEQIIERYDSDHDQFMMLTSFSGGYQFVTKEEYSGLIRAHLKNVTKKRLSKAAIETLAIIAYKQPVTKPEVERIRGVSCDYTIQKLLEKEYVAVLGRADIVGKPILYGTSDKFMDHFGLRSLGDLPTLKEMVTEDQSVGEEQSIEEITAYLEENKKHGSTTNQSDSEE